MVKREQEDKIIGNLKRQFFKPTMQGQRGVGISPAIANGNIALGYYRGLNVGRDEGKKEIIALIKSKFPKVALYIKNNYKP